MRAEVAGRTLSEAIAEAWVSAPFDFDAIGWKRRAEFNAEVAREWFAARLDDPALTWALVSQLHNDAVAGSPCSCEDTAAELLAAIKSAVA